jgi:hypothetical protein
MRWFCAAVAVGLLALLAPPAPASDDAARAVVEKGIKAQGGAIKLSGSRVMRITLQGRISQRPGPVTRPVIIEKSTQMPDLYTTEIRVADNGKEVVQTQFFCGENVYIWADGILRSMPRQAAAEMLASSQAEDLDRLDFLADERCQVTSIPYTKVEARDAAGVLVQVKGRHDVKLYFDKQSGLLVKREHQLRDSATGKEIIQEVIFGDYVAQPGGVKACLKVTIYRDGRQFLEAWVIERTFFEGRKLNPQRLWQEWDPRRHMGDFPPFPPSSPTTKAVSS